MHKRTKIICTIGPATESTAIISGLIKNGMNIARLNFSHGTHESHRKSINNIRKAAGQTKNIISIIADLQGPKIRLGELKESVDLKKGKRLILTTGKESKTKIGVTYNKLHRDVRSDNRVLINDGLVEVKVEKVKGRDIFCRVVVGGRISSHKGMNFPDSKINLSSLTKKDAQDLFFAMQNKIDYVALSFVRSEKDIIQLERLLNKYSKKIKTSKPKIIAKIEKGEALENFASILKRVGAVMVARGDLGIEIPAENVPLRQKEMIMLCRQCAKPVIVATQMLDSMIRNPRPTRAEVSDVANAVMDNVDGIMLSGETAIGKYPKEAVAMMGRIALETEKSPYDDVSIGSGGSVGEKDAIGKSVAILIRKTEIKEVVDLSDNDLYRYISKWRPEADIFARTDEQNLYPNLFWGVQPFIVKSKESKTVLAYLRKNKLLKKKFILLTGEDKIEIID